MPALPELEADRARRLRMAALLLAPDPAGRPGPADVAGVVRHLGAMQAQDAESGLWSLGIRLPGATRESVVAALERREALRTWPMRGTVHLVPARDARWMLQVTGSRALAQGARRRASLGISERDADRAVDAVGTALAGGQRLTRSAVIDAIRDAGVPVTGQRGYHLLWYASQRGVSAIAPDVDGEQSFVLLDAWVPDPVDLDRDAALATLATRFFTSHGPATLRDFIGWTGLTAVDARRGIDLAQEDLAGATVLGEAAWLDPALLGAPPPALVPTVAPPGFDELLLGAKDRRLHLADGDLDAVVPGGNGVFRATVVHDGTVVATWTRSTRGRRGVVTATALRPLAPRARDGAESAIGRWGAFADLAVDVRWAERA